MTDAPAATPPAATPPAAIAAWFQTRLPDGWSAVTAPDITVDREEITVVIALAPPEVEGGDDPVVRAQADAGRVAGFREDTRDQRMAIAREAEHRFERKVAWGVRIGDTTSLFTHLAVPVMTRLRQRERLVLDTLVAANVARSRADALAWCVRLVGQHEGDWLTDLRAAMESVADVRGRGPAA